MADMEKYGVVDTEQEKTAASKAKKQIEKAGAKRAGPGAVPDADAFKNKLGKPPTKKPKED